MTTEDAGWIRHHCQDVEGFWPLEAIDAEGVLMEAREQWADHPALERLAYDAAERIANKWTGSGNPAVLPTARACSRASPTRPRRAPACQLPQIRA
jgi:hypothetical protein